jgi:hypothetical protein
VSLSSNESVDSLISNNNETSNALPLQQAMGRNNVLKGVYVEHMPLYNRQKMLLANIQQLETYHIIQSDFSINSEEGILLLTLVVLGYSYKTFLMHHILTQMDNP